MLQFLPLHTALLSGRGGGALRRLVPPALGAPLMTTTYVLVASLQTALLFLGWTPIGRVLWQAHGAVFAVFALCYCSAWLLLLKAIIDAGFALQTACCGGARWCAMRGRSTLRCRRAGCFG